MDSRQPIQTKPVLDTETDRALQMSSGPKWNAPLITRIDIKRTMGNGGTNIDLFSGSKE